MRTIASRWLRMATVSETDLSRRKSCAENYPFFSPIDSASPESSISVREDATRYKPNLSEDEPLFSASTFKSGRGSVGPLPGPGLALMGSSASRAPPACRRRAR